MFPPNLMSQIGRKKELLYCYRAQETKRCNPGPCTQAGTGARAGNDLRTCTGIRDSVRAGTCTSHQGEPNQKDNEHADTAQSVRLPPVLFNTKTHYTFQI